MINGEITKDNFEFDYFKENKNEILFHRTILLSANHLKVLINKVNQLKNSIYNKENSEFQIIMSKLVDNHDNAKFLQSLCAENDLIVKKIIKVEKHKGQKRKQGTPYYTHPLAVSELLKKKEYEV